MEGTATTYLVSLTPMSIAFWEPVLDRLETRSMGTGLSFLRWLDYTNHGDSLKSALYYLWVFKIPKKLAKEIENMQRNFLWCRGDSGLSHHKLDYCSPKQWGGGLGVGRIREKNLALLAKWPRGFPLEQDSLWTSTIRSIMVYKMRLGIRFQKLEPPPTKTVSSESDASELVQAFKDGGTCNGERWLPSQWLHWYSWVNDYPLKDKFLDLWVNIKKESLMPRSESLPHSTLWQRGQKNIKSDQREVILSGIPLPTDNPFPYKLVSKCLAPWKFCAFVWEAMWKKLKTLHKSKRKILIWLDGIKCARLRTAHLEGGFGVAKIVERIRRCLVNAYGDFPAKLMLCGLNY